MSRFALLLRAVLALVALSIAMPAFAGELDKAGIEPDAGVTPLAGFVEAAKKRYWDREANVRTLA